MKPREEAKTRGKPNKFGFVALEKYACCEFHLIIYFIGIHKDDFKSEDLIVSNKLFIWFQYFYFRFLESEQKEQGSERKSRNVLFIQLSNEVSIKCENFGWPSLTRKC